MSRRKQILAIVILLVLLCGSAGIYFGYINDKSYVAIRMRLAEMHLEQERDEKAEALYLKVLNCDAQNTEAYLALGGLYMEQERYTDAIDLLKKAYDLTGEKRSFRGPLTEAYLARAEELMDKGEPKTAIALLKKAVERYVEPQDVRGLFSEACLMRAMQIRDAGELEQA
ncbi:MAG: tetratricopeptide repeat protein, partial [Lachnospiraceae bacterium]|nr:tetratricopeptide repeat protein [Lachnospiraceae bacterium]